MFCKREQQPSPTSRDCHGGADTGGMQQCFELCSAHSCVKVPVHFCIVKTILDVILIANPINVVRVELGIEVVVNDAVLFLAIVVVCCVCGAASVVSKSNGSSSSSSLLESCVGS